MKKSEKIAHIMEVLDRLYPAPAIPLRHHDPYTLLVAVILSAQCTDKRVNEVTPELFRLADTPEKMARLGQKRIESIVRPCGLAPAKSKNIHTMSRLLLERHAGKVPGDFEQLLALPGVGRKTASVLMCQAFGQPAAPIDTHIHRLLQRWGLSKGNSSVVEAERDYMKCFPRSSWAKLHLQIIYFGREHCPARGHEPAQCPICGFC